MPLKALFAILLFNAFSAPAHALQTIAPFHAIESIPSIRELDFSKADPPLVPTPAERANREESEDTTCGTLSADECTLAANQEDARGNHAKANALMLEACIMGERFACTKLGLYERDRRGGNRVLGNKLLERGCKLGMKDACWLSR